MARKKEYRAPVEITSSKQAMRETLRLPNFWSYESLLTQRILIHVMELLEEQNALLSLMAHRAPPKVKKALSLAAERPASQPFRKLSWFERTRRNIFG